MIDYHPTQLKALKEYYNELRDEYDALHGSGAYDKLDYKKWKKGLDDYNKQIKKEEADAKDRERRKKNVNDFNKMAGRSSYRHH